MSKLTKEQKKELERQRDRSGSVKMKLDYENHPSDMSGSIVVVHEKSEYLDEEE